MSTSLRQRIVLGTTVAMSAVVLVGGIAVWLAAHALLYRMLDEHLREQVRTATMLPPGPPRDRPQRPDPDGRPPPPRDHQQEPPMPVEFSAEGGRSFFQIVDRADGSEIFRSPSLPAGVALRDLAPQPLPIDRPLSVRLPDGRPLRMMVISLTDGERPLRLPPWLRVGLEHRSEEREARDGRDGRDPRDGRDTRDTRQLHLLLAVDEGPTISDELRLGWTLAILWLVTTGLGALVAIWLQRAVLRPLERIAQAITAVDPASLRRRIAMDDVPDEMRAVMERLNDLLQRLEAAFTRERGTIANIAHELRTPVTGLLMTLELEIARLPPTEQPAAITTCWRIATSMQAMITNLLALARSEAGAGVIVTRDVDLVPLLSECWSLLAARADERHLIVQWKLPATCRLRGDPDQVRMVLTNLFDNAVSYTPMGGAITISLTDEPQLQLTVRNDTDGSLRDCSQVFQPFWRGDAARSAGLHCGLGLALVRQLTSSLRGTVHAELDERGGFVIRLDLPLA